MEAPSTETIFQEFKDEGLIVLGAGSDWGQPYSCRQWATKFDLTYPLINDSDYNLFYEFAWDGSSQPGVQYYVPMNIILDHNMVVRYRDYGFSESAVKKEIKELIEEMPAVSVAPEVSEMITPSEIELFDVYPFEAGRHQLRWDAGDLPSGVYLIRLETSRSSKTTKAILLR